MVVATVNGIDITALDVMMELSWAAQMLTMEYIELFPYDTEFDFDKPFRGEETFGRVLLEEAVRFAAHVKLYYDFAAMHDIPWEESGFQHPVVEVVTVIVSDPEMFAQFESYMPDDTTYIYIEKAEELLERLLAGEDFSELVEIYGEEPGMANFPEGYTFVRGDMVLPFEEATLELEVGEISGLVFTDFGLEFGTHVGIHIIKRVEPNPENLMSELPEDSDEELLGAKHILIRTSALTPESRMFEAVYAAFDAKWGASNIDFLETLNDIPLGG